jgi:hypothetical protein
VGPRYHHEVSGVQFGDLLLIAVIPGRPMGSIVTVFGGTGFLGRRVVQHLRKRQYSVRIASRQPDRGRIQFDIEDPQRQIIEADIHDERSVTNALAGADGVVNALVFTLSAEGTGFILCTWSRCRPEQVQQDVPPGAYPTRCRAVVHNGIVSISQFRRRRVRRSTSRPSPRSLKSTRTWQRSAPSKVVSFTALVFITDMAQKDEMNRAWDEWADRANPPMRACVAVGLTGDSLVEIVLTAAI